MATANFATAIAFALQQGNIARIFETLGARMDDLPILMIAGPVTGLIVQPIIGRLSDGIWVRIGDWGGRRLPWMAGGAIASSLALWGMAHAQVLWVAIACFWLLDAALNVVMEPFRALVGDMVPADQRAQGLSVNAALGCLGAVGGFLAPYLLAHFGWNAGAAAGGGVPPSVRFALMLSAGVMLLGTGYTLWRIREYTPAQQAAFAGSDAVAHKPSPGNPLMALWRDIVAMPPSLRRLTVVQFFSWFALFIMWPFMTPVVTRHVFGASRAGSAAYEAGADWVGVLFAGFNVVAALFGLLALPRLARGWGVAHTHAACLGAGVCGFLLIVVLRDPVALFVPFALLGLAWASMLTLPYVMLTDALGGQRLGTYTGIFNIFVVLPQIAVATVMGPVLRAWFPDQPVWTMAVAAASLAAAAGLTLVLRPDRH
ncbi:MFS transporter [Novosphingobium ovatum]|nr:MFS transporter [Novosphingobium ovatum]